ncbi:hypothetical protein MRX96_056425 [Rhipicephalus microplus]
MPNGRRDLSPPQPSQSRGVPRSACGVRCDQGRAETQRQMGLGSRDEGRLTSHSGAETPGATIEAVARLSIDPECFPSVGLLACRSAPAFLFPTAGEAAVAAQQRRRQSR